LDTWIAPNVGIVTFNHDFLDVNNYLPGSDVIIGKKCWIGMNSMILPGVCLGDNTIVGAGSIVTKSFPEGYVVIAGNPAKIIKKIK
jgi:acetyltransferase-like isoleucine patch superfamily enzyme